MKDPATTRAIKLALDLDPRCQVYLARATALRDAYHLVWGETSLTTDRTLLAHMRTASRSAVARARLRLPYYLQCVPRTEAAASA